MPEPRQHYANTRLQARRAMRLGGARWALLGSSRGAGHYLDTLRGLRAPDFVVPDALRADDADAQEAWLRTRWRARCAEIAAWQPPRWRPSYAWCAVLPDLGTLEWLRAHEVAAPWLHADGWLAPVAAAADRGAALAHSRYAPLGGAWQRGEALPAAWLRHWHALQAATSGADRGALEALEGAVRGAIDRPLAARREALEATAQRVARRNGASPAVGFAALLLLALDLERVRGDLAVRLVGDAPEALP